MKTHAKARLPSKQMECDYQIGTWGFLCCFCFHSAASDQAAVTTTDICSYSDQGTDILYRRATAPFAVTALKKPNVNH